MWAVEGAEKQQGMGTMVGDDILFGDISNLSDLIPCSPSSSESLFDFRLFRWRWFVILFGVSFHFSALLIYQGWAKREFSVDWSWKLFYVPLQDFPPKNSDLKTPISSVAMSVAKTIAQSWIKPHNALPSTAVYSSNWVLHRCSGLSTERILWIVV